ncbi:cyclin-I2 [Pseudophryne corroboree]|uniref:cyclin-I2 n=1 Tax=Pseudophryne corroboree TaxID=495146 RepID=UPI0030820DA6
MKCTSLSEIQRLEILLNTALLTESSKWRVPCFLDSTIKGTDISTMQYEQTVLWMEELKSRFQFYPETFGLAVSILNRILASVKVQVKYLQCITVTCLYLAAKTNEEDEIIPSVKTLAVQSGCMYSSAEILRMERIILNKLQWDLYMATPVDFLNTVDPAKFFSCKELVDRCLETPSNPVYILMSARKDVQDYHHKEQVSCCVPSAGYTTPAHCVTVTTNQPIPDAFFPHIKHTPRNVMETDDFFDGFRHLYNEDCIQDRSGIQEVLIGNKSHMVEVSSNPCPPPLQSPCPD